jgi:acetoin utilization deacetylase AcuC-like enzyme
VHHGNGTQEVFWSDGSVLFFDIHQHPWIRAPAAPTSKGPARAAVSSQQPVPVASHLDRLAAR